MLAGKLKQERDGAETVFLRRDTWRRGRELCVCPEEGKSISNRNSHSKEAGMCVPVGF